MNVLFTGGSGVLGSAVRMLRPDWQYPPRDVISFSAGTGYEDELYWNIRGADVVIHAAALTSPPRCNAEPMDAVQVNIIGTAWLVRACEEREIRLVYISTDYVFRGDEAPYAEDSTVCPVNKYAWSKLGGECAVRLYDKGLIVRGSFSQIPYPHPRAFTDQWTTRLPVEEFAKKLVAIVERKPPVFGVVHICGKRQTVYDYARSLPGCENVGQISRLDIATPVPEDTSLISTREDMR